MTAIEQDDRSLPASLDAERSILGAFLLDNNLFAQAEEHLVAHDFSLDSHRRIYSRIAKLIDSGRPVDIVTLAEELARRKEVEAAGGVAYLASLTEGLPRRVSIEEYVRIVKDKSILRQAIAASERTISRAYDQGDEAEAVLSDAQAEWDKITQRAVGNSLETIKDYLKRTHPQIDTFLKRDAKEQGCPTGFKELDKITCGFQKKDLIVIAARPSMGKTALAANIANDVAIGQRKVVALFELEMSSDALIDRIVCGRAQVSLQERRAGTLGGLSQKYFAECLGDVVDESTLFLDDTPMQTLAQIYAKAHRVKARHGLDLVLIDYISLIQPAIGASRGENREQQIAGISRGLKAIAKRLDVPVVALAQLSREVEKRGDHRPKLSDLRESGAIEQDADLVIFLHREEYYTPNETSVQGKAELIVAKQRQGPLGTANVFYKPSCTRFFNEDPDKPVSMW